MVFEDFVYRVPKKWYWIQWSSMVVMNVILLVGFVAAQLLPNLPYIGQYLSFSTSVGIVASITLFYLLIPFWAISAKSSSMAFACFLGSMIHAQSMFNVLNQTIPETNALPYAIMWLITCFMGGVYGPIIVLGYLVVTVEFVLLKSSFGIDQIAAGSYLVLFGSIFSILMVFLFWRNRYRSASGQQTSQLQTLLRDRERQVEILVESIDDGIIVFDTSYSVQLINKSACEKIGWPVKEAIGIDARPVMNIIEDEKTQKKIDDDNHPFARVLARHDRFNETVTLLSRNNKILYVSLVVSPITLPKQNTVVGGVAIFRDISKEKQEERQRAEFISTASHEMRTPVAAIEGYLALALNINVSTIDEKARSYIEKAHTSTQHLGQLFQDLLTSAKAEDGRLSSRPQVVEMGQFLERLVDDLRFVAEKKDLEVEFIISNTEGDTTIDATGGSTKKTVQPLYYTNVDIDRIREVITNIFDNAVKYTDKGKISLGITGNRQVLQIRISDTGPGIPPEDLPHLFQKFYRVDNSATRTVGGTGLGLFICKKIVELYNGRIWADSEVGKGSTFYINLPRIDSQRAQQMTAQQQPAEKINPGA